MKKYRYLVMIFAVLILSGCSKEEQTKEITEILYTTSSFGVITQVIKVDMDDATKKIFINPEYSKGGAPREIGDIPEHDFEMHEICEVGKFEKEINKTGIFNWKEKYVNKNIMDGYQWSLAINYKDGQSKSMYGSNDKPKKYDELISVLFNTEK